MTETVFDQSNDRMSSQDPDKDITSVLYLDIDKI